MLNKSRPVLKAHQEVPRPPHEDGPRATQKRRSTARSAQQMTRLPPSRTGEYTDGRTRTSGALPFPNSRHFPNSPYRPFRAIFPLPRGIGKMNFARFFKKKGKRKKKKKRKKKRRKS